MLGSREHLEVIGTGEVWAQHQHARQVDLARRDLLEQDRELPRDLGGVGAPQCGVFGHAKLVDAIRVQAGTSSHTVDTAGLHLGEVSQKRGQDLIGATHLAASARQEVVVGEVNRGSRREPERGYP